MKKVDESGQKKLTVKQKKVIELIAWQGLSQNQAAKVVNLSKQAVSKWFTKNDFFVKEYEKEEKIAQDDRRRRYKGLSQIALDKLEKLVESNDDKTALAACKDILDRAGDKPTDDINISGTVEAKGQLDSILKQLEDE